MTVRQQMTICKKSNCLEKPLARNLCNGHYAKWRRRHLDGHLGINRSKYCIYEDCKKRSRVRNLCLKHYNRVKYHGNLHHYPKIVGFDTGIPT